MKIRIVETRKFSKDLDSLLNKKSLLLEDFESFKRILSENPKQGDIVSGAGGIRKTRLKSATKGKSGGFRVCYFYYQEDEGIFLILIYPKNVQEDLTIEQKKMLRETVNEIKKQ
jgi:mRNA-degrading endonuclease RelE of RelBE toxin-antitoxin system